MNLWQVIELVLDEDLIHLLLSTLQKFEWVQTSFRTKVLDLISSLMLCFLVTYRAKFFVSKDYLALCFFCSFKIECMGKSFELVV